MLAVRPRYWFSIVLLTLVTVLSISPRLASAQEVDEGARKVKSKIQPIYPELARRMNVSGSVKVQVVVSPNGAIKSTKVIGGHPLLVEPAVEALKRWKFEPGSDETTTTVEFKFNNNQ